MEIPANLRSPRVLTALWQRPKRESRAYLSVSRSDYAPPLSRRSSPFVAEGW